MPANSIWLMVLRLEMSTTSADSRLLPATRLCHCQKVERKRNQPWAPPDWQWALLFLHRLSELWRFPWEGWADCPTRLWKVKNQRQRSRWRCICIIILILHCYLVFLGFQWHSMRREHRPAMPERLKLLRGCDWSSQCPTSSTSNSVCQYYHLALTYP